MLYRFKLYAVRLFCLGLFFQNSQAMLTSKTATNLALNKSLFSLGKYGKNFNFDSRNNDFSKLVLKVQQQGKKNYHRQEHFATGYGYTALAALGAGSALFSYKSEEEDQGEKIKKAVADQGIKATIACVLSGGKNKQCLPYQPSFTEKHLVYNAGKVQRDHRIQRFFSDPELSILADRVNQLQKKLESQGFYPFIHGQFNGYIFYEKLYTFLWSLKHNQSIDDFLFVHVKHISSDQKKEQNLRKKLLNMGPTNEFERQHLLFLNYALFGNISNLGASSAMYIEYNKNVSFKQLTANQCFKLAGYSEKICDKLKAKVAELEEEYKNISKYGTALLVAIPQEKIDQNIIVTLPKGDLREIYIKDLGETSNIKTIMETLRDNPEKVLDSDDGEFCLVMTSDKDGGLNPASGIKIFPVMAASDEKLQELKKKEQDLFNAIKKAVQDHPR